MNAAQGKLCLEYAEKQGTLREADEGVRYTMSPRQDGVTQSIIVWRPGSFKPVAYYAVRNEDRGLELVREAVEAQKSRAKYQAERKATEKQRTAEYRATFQVGTILYNSWGYDQTNVDFYQVIARSKTGATVTVRQIASESVEGSEGFMSCKVRPLPYQFIGEPWKARVGAYGVKVTGGHASPCSDTAEFYRSWYA